MRKHVKERRERLRKLGEQDAALRCGYCKAVTPTRCFLRWGDPALYCSEHCLAAVNERDGRTF